MIKTLIKVANMNFDINRRNYYVVPVLLSLIVVLILTLSNRFPLGWDIYTHINYALAYLHNGITSVDYLLNAPAGKTIGYPPFFHMLLILASFVSGSMIEGARLLQVVLSVCNIFVICWAAKEFFDERVGFFAGILLLSSFMITRFFLPIPETLALIFFTLAVLFYYKAAVESSYKYSLIVVICSLLTLAAHFSSFVYLMALLFVLMIVLTIILRNFNAIEYYVYIILPIFLISLVALGAMFVLGSSYLTQILEGVVSIITNPFDLFMGQVAMGLERYVRCVGIVSLLFSILGLFYSFKNREFLFVSIWALIAFVVSNLHWFGIPVYTFRMLIYLIIPMVMLGAYGIVKLLEDIKDYNPNTIKIFTIVLIILSFVLCMVNINDPSVQIYKSTTEQSTYQIAPPTSDEVELINWFENENVENKSILINNLFLGTVISSIDEIPIHYGFDMYTNKSLSKSSLDSLNNESIVYIVYDKSLVINDTDNYDSLDVRYVNGSYYPSYYFTKQITENNFNEIMLQHSEKTFENERFIVCKIN